MKQHLKIQKSTLSRISTKEEETFFLHQYQFESLFLDGQSIKLNLNILH